MSNEERVRSAKRGEKGENEERRVATHSHVELRWMDVEAELTFSSLLTPLNLLAIRCGRMVM